MSEWPPGTASRANLKKGVAQHIRDQILSGALKPEERLDQNGIADALDVSRVPVREALITLEVEGLVNNISRRGSFVARLEPADISDHYEMYGHLSGIAAARVSERGETAEILPQLDELCRDMRDTDDPNKRDPLNFTFHQLINQTGGSGRLRAVLRNLSNSMPTRFYGTDESAWCAEALDEHETIVKAIRNGDPDGASAAMIAHFRNTGEQAVQRLRSSGFWDDSAGTDDA